MRISSRNGQAGLPQVQTGPVNETGPLLKRVPVQRQQSPDAWRDAGKESIRNTVTWAAEAMPLQIWLAPDGQEEMLFKAMRQWQGASLGMIRFERTLDRTLADITVDWSDTATPGREFEVGHTDRETLGPRIRRVVITLITEPVIDGHLDPEAQQQRLLTTVLHETGHALGLEHSDQESDVMHHRGWKNPALTENDSRRIQELYRNANQARLG